MNGLFQQPVRDYLTSGCSLIVSWNFKHIVHFEKIPLYNAVNTLRGHSHIGIFSPLEVIQTDSMFEPIHIGQDDALYPPALRFYLTDRAPAAITARGNLDILHGNARTPIVALFCSVQCSGAVVLQTYALARALRDAGVTVISGFHSPMEKECLTVLLGGTQPVIICPARSIERMRLLADRKAALTQGCLLLLSPFEEKFRRATTGRARTRNEFVAALADVLFIAHAAPGGKTERFCRDLLAWGKPLLTLESEENAGLLALGARAVRPDHISRGEVFPVETEPRS